MRRLVSATGTAHRITLPVRVRRRETAIFRPAENRPGQAGKIGGNRTEQTYAPETDPRRADHAGWLTDRIYRQHQGRRQDLLARKLQRMSEDPYSWFRGTVYLFHERLPAILDRQPFPDVWLNGDLHLENFASYRGSAGETCFDLSDFDEGGLGSAARDLLRFLTSIPLALDMLGIDPDQAMPLMESYLSAYRQVLKSGRAERLSPQTASGIIGAMLSEQDRQSQADLLRQRTRIKDGQPEIRMDTGKAVPLAPGIQDRVIAAIADFAEQEATALGLHPDWFRVIDVKQRIAGMGTLGLPRYIALVQGGELPAMIDLKVQPGSVMRPYLRADQPDFGCEARRAVAIERRLQASAPVCLGAVRIDGQSFSLRELQSGNDGFSLKLFRQIPLARRQGALDATLTQMGRLTGWAHLRSAGMDGSHDVPALQAFGRDDGWQPVLLAEADRLARETLEDWELYRSTLRDPLVTALS